MKYEKSEWFKGLLFAEQQSQDGWRVCELDYVEQWFSWTYMDTKAKQTVFGECEWLNGVMLLGNTQTYAECCAGYKWPVTFERLL